MRLPQLDLLRALAVLLVIGRHYNINPIWHRFGWTGVNLFFVLSGFLISGLLFAELTKHGQLHVGRFLIRRAFKIYPAFYLFIAWSVAIYFLFGKGLSWRQTLAELTFLQNYFTGLWVHTWSLAVEEHFYLALPVLLLLMLRWYGRTEDPFRSIPLVYALVAASTFLLRAWHVARHPIEPGTVIGMTHLVVDDLMLGVMLSYFRHFRRSTYDRVVKATRVWLLPGAILLVAPCALPGAGSGAVRWSLEHLLLSWGYGALLVAALEWDPLRAGTTGRAFNSAIRGAAYLGSHSYSVYLWHAAMVTWGLDLLRRSNLLPESRLAQFVIYLVGSFALGIGMARLIEDPFLKLRDHLFPTRSRILQKVQ